MRAALLALAAVLTASGANAQMPRFDLRPIPRPAEPDAIPLYPTGTMPQGAVPESWGNLVGDFADGSHQEARIARNVSIPTMTAVLPDPAKATGAAVIVAPGGAFLSLSMDSEGFQVAHWLADHGIAAFVLKYRLNQTPAETGAFMAMVGERMGREVRDGSAGNSFDPHAPADALQAIRLVRAGAARWHVDPKRVGMIGFSAGAMTALQSVLSGDAASRPAFFGYIYGPMRDVAVPAGAPAMFAALALDDPLFGHQGFGIVGAWQKAHVPVELHAYERGDHGFGMGRAGTTSTLVMEEFRLWLQTNGFLGK